MAEVIELKKDLHGKRVWQYFPSHGKPRIGWSFLYVYKGYKPSEKMHVFASYKHEPSHHIYFTAENLTDHFYRRIFIPVVV
jgi:hypothetical protein